VKRSIEWHEECLKNNKRFIKEKREEIRRLQLEIDQNLFECEMYELQISEAKKKKMNGFDSGLFMEKIKEKRYEEEFGIEEDKCGAR